MLIRVRWVAIGRLHLNPSGLLLFTDSGELANQLMHPRHEIEREYEVRVQGGLDAEAVRRLLAGRELGGGPAMFQKVEAIQGRENNRANRWYRALPAQRPNHVDPRRPHSARGTVDSTP